jgi:hypothetical protein
MIYDLGETVGYPVLNIVNYPPGSRDVFFFFHFVVYALQLDHYRALSM